ncbi:MAG: glycosyltransferase, partial [Bacteroidota bacterium]
MRILYVTNMFPTEQKPYYGIFVKEQIEDVAQVIDLDYDVHFINAREKGPLEYLKSIFTIPRLIRREDYDLVHIHYGFSGLWRLFYKPKAKVFLSLHGADILAEQGKGIQVAVTKRLLKKVDRVFTLNDRMDDIVRRHTDKFEMLPCAVNINLFKPASSAEASNHRKTIFYLYLWGAWENDG